MPVAYDLAAGETQAKAYFKKGVIAETRDDYESAYQYYRQALTKEPENLRYKAACERTRVSAASLFVKRGERLVEQGSYRAALVQLLRALDIDPSNELAQQDINAVQSKLNGVPTVIPETSISQESLKRLDRLRSPVELKALNSEPISLHMVEDSKIVYNTIARIAGINVIFDPDYNSKRISVDLKNISFSEAIDIVAMLSNTFWRPATPDTIFVAQNSRAKRTEEDQQGLQTFYLSNASQQSDLNDVQTGLRNVLPNAKLYGIPGQNAILVRGTPDELMLAAKCIDDLDKAKPEVVIDVAVLEVSRDKLSKIGIQLPQTATVNLQANTSSNSSTSTTTSSSSSSTNSNLTLNTLAHLNASNFAVTLGQAEADLLLTDNDTRVLQNPRVRATDGQQATLKIGSRIPIATGSYSSGVSTGTVSTGVQTQFQYIDVGVNIDMKPTVHFDRDVTLKVKVEVSSQSGNVTISGVTEPIISQRTLEQTIRLKEGEVNLVGGLLDREESLSVSGAPGAEEIPVLKYLFSTRQREVKDDEIVFLLIPHVVRSTPISPLNQREIDTGTAGEVRVRMAEVASPTSIPSAGFEDLFQPMQTPRVPSPPNSRTSGAPKLQFSGAAEFYSLNQEFTVALNLSNGSDIEILPIQVKYDPASLVLIKAVSQVDGTVGSQTSGVERDDLHGELTINRVSASRKNDSAAPATICLLTFRAFKAGSSKLQILRSIASDWSMQNRPVEGDTVTLSVH